MTRKRVRTAPAAEPLEGRALFAASMLGDLNTYTASSSPAGFTATADGTVYFVATTGPGGAELYRTDGTAVGTRLVADVRPGAGSGASYALFDYPDAMAAVGNTLYFAGDDGSTGAELWRTDGTTAGTVRVADLAAGSAGSRPNHFAVAGGLLFFTATVGGVNRLWRSDGTAAGTFAVSSGAVGTTAAPTPVGSRVLFRASLDAAGDEVWASDGTVAGTTRLTDLNPGAAASSPYGFTAAGSDGYFTAISGSTTTPYGIYRTDGTAAGTVLVKAFAATAVPAMPTWCGARLYFAVGGSLWTSDGTAAGTAAVGTAVAGVVTIAPAAEQPGAAYVGTSTGTVGSQAVWRTDGTAPGTTQILTLPAAGNANGYPTAFTAIGGGVSIFVASLDGGTTRALFRTDGTAAGTARVSPTGASPSVFRGSANYNPDLEGPTIMPVGGGWAVFAAYSAAAGTELWSTDGTAAGTGLLADVNADTRGSNPAAGVALGNRLLFRAAGSEGGAELYVTDGTGAGTALVKDIWPGPSDTADPASLSNSGFPDDLVRAGPYVFFRAADPTGGRELWRSDGTAAGTVRVKDINPGAADSFPDYLTAVGDVLYFAATDADGGTELWRSDGTDAGTVRVSDVSPGTASSTPRYLTAVGNTIYFTATNGTSGYELWRSDGTAAGTARVKDLSPGSGSANPTNLAAVGTTLYFSSFLSTSGWGLYRTDGTDAGTTRVAAMSAGNVGTAAAVELGGALLFVGDLGSGLELCRTDGTTGGTSMVKDIYAGPFASSPTDLTISGSRVFFTADDGTSGRELWVTDGTAVGTVRAADLTPGATSSNPTALRAVSGGRVVCGTYSSTLGTRFWASDGTDAGTVQLGTTGTGSAALRGTDVSAVGLLPSPAGPTAARFVVGATEGSHGSEPWVVDVPAAPVPRLSLTAVNGGAAQRSMLTTMGFTFDRAVTLDAGAFEVAGATVSAANPSGDGKAWVLTFAAADGSPLPGGSLPDGRSFVTIVAAKVHAGNRDGAAMAANAFMTFHRLFGDADGDGDVDGADSRQFRTALGWAQGDLAYNPIFDSDGDGDVDGADSRQFRARLGTTI